VLCVACPTPPAYSETFIAAHIQRLPFTNRLLYGAPLPRFDEHGRNLLGPLDLLRGVRRIAPGAVGRTAEGLRRRWHRRVIASHLVRTHTRAVLAEFGPTGAAMVSCCRRAGVPLVVHFHGYDAYREDTLALHSEAYREMFAVARYIVAVSRDMERQLAELGAPREKIRRIVYGVDAQLFAGAFPARAAPRLLAVGRFVEKKGPALTLSAFARAQSRHADARLVMIGDGPLLAACRASAEQLGLADRVEFLGVLEPAAVAAEMRNARGFVQHSIRASNGDCEGTPVAVLEAQSAGLPVVATRHAGIADVVIDGETGLLVAERDVEGMSAAMLRILEQPETAHRWGEAGRRRVLASFTLDASISKLAELL
jgi:glycosyltransferase involved in cell wall biosynthesis